MKTIPTSRTSAFRLAAVALAVLVAPALFAQMIEEAMPFPSESSKTSAESAAKHSDRSFLKKAITLGDDGLNFSTVASHRSTHPQVKELAQAILVEHHKMSAELTRLAQVKGVELPAKQQSDSGLLEKSAKDFDRSYLKKIIANHEDAVDLHAKAAKGEDPQIAAYAAQQLPVLQSHLAKAQAVLKTLP